jgi:hypothetical protein
MRENHGDSLARRGGRRQGAGSRNGHADLEVVRWLNAKTLRVRMGGYGEHDPEGFDELFDDDVGGRFRRAAI